MQTWSTKWNNSIKYAGIFLYKSINHTKHSWQCIIGFWINAALLNFYFIVQSYFFFVKKFIFSNVNISVNATCKCLYIIFGCERGHQLSTYTTLGDGGGHLKCIHLRTGGGRVTLYVYVHTCTISFHVFGSIFVL